MPGQAPARPRPPRAADLDVLPADPVPAPGQQLARVRRGMGSLGRIIGPGPVLLVMTLGLLPIAAAGSALNASPGGDAWRPAYLLGILMVVVPAAVGLATPRVRSGTPVALALGMAFLLQIGEILLQPNRFVQDDDVLRVLTVQQIEQSGRLFDETPFTPDLAAYPGLGVATEGLHALTGLSLHASAMTLTVLARMVIALAVLLLVAHITRSRRIGALAVVVYALNPQLLSGHDPWSPAALALALAVFAGYLVVSRCRDGRTSVAAAALALLAVAVTDQRTALVTVLALVGWLILELLLRNGRASSARALVTLLALAVVEVAAVALHASAVTGSPALEDRPLETVSGPSWSTALASAPGWLAAVAVGVTVLVVLAVVLALVKGRLFVRTRVAVAVLLGVGALLYPLVAFGDLVPQATGLVAWAGGLVVLGVAFVVAWWYWQRPPRWWRAALLGVAAALLGVGGAVGVVGTQLPTGQVMVSDQIRGFDPDTVAVTAWMSSHLSPDSRVYVDRTGSLLLSIAGRPVPVPDVSTTSVVAQDAFTEHHVRYVVADRRSTTGPSPDALTIVAATPGVDVIYDSGTVVVYDLEVLDAPG